MLRSTAMGAAIGQGSMPGVDNIPQHLPCLEVRAVYLRHLHRFACLGVSPNAWWPVVQAEDTEAPNLNPAALRQRARDCPEDFCYRDVSILADELWKALGQNGDQL